MRELDKEGFDKLNLTKTFAAMGRDFPDAEDIIDKVVQKTEDMFYSIHSDVRKKKQDEVRRIMLYFIDSNIKSVFPDGQSGYVVALRELTNLFNLAQTDNDWDLYERCKKANEEG